jgi:hypothetical protein
MSPRARTLLAGSRLALNLEMQRAVSVKKCHRQFEDLLNILTLSSILNIAASRLAVLIPSYEISS